MRHRHCELLAVAHSRRTESSVALSTERLVPERRSGRLRCCSFRPQCAGSLWACPGQKIVPLPTGATRVVRPAGRASWSTAGVALAEGHEPALRFLPRLMVMFRPPALGSCDIHHTTTRCRVQPRHRIVRVWVTPQQIDESLLHCILRSPAPLTRVERQRRPVCIDEHLQTEFVQMCHKLLIESWVQLRFCHR